MIKNVTEDEILLLEKIVIYYSKPTGLEQTCFLFELKKFFLFSL